MAGREPKVAHSIARIAPRDVILMLSSALGLFVAVGCGSLLQAASPPQSPWLFMLSFAGPAAVVFAVFWLVTRRL